MDVLDHPSRAQARPLAIPSHRSAHLTPMTMDEAAASIFSAKAGAELTKQSPPNP